MRNSQLLARMMRAVQLSGGEASAPPWYRIQAATDDVARVDILDDIGMWGVSAAQFIGELLAVKAANIDLHINSYGGEVFDGIAIYNAIKAHPARVTVHVDGLAASIASVIAMAGDEIIIHEAASIMIHNAWTMAVGDSDDMLRAAAELRDINAAMAELYARRTKVDLASIVQMMRDETLMVGRDAVTAGFADHYEGGSPLAEADPVPPPDHETLRRTMRARMAAVRYIPRASALSENGVH